MKIWTKIGIWTGLIIILGISVFLYFRYFFVFGEGVKAGELNQVMYKGWVFKTYEGRLIQSGFKGAEGGGSIQSNQFDFSVTDKSVADSLMRCSGKHVELHYKEYLHTLPWRGMQNKIVDRILSVSQVEKSNTVIPVGVE